MKRVKSDRKPEWAPDRSGDEFASYVIPGAQPGTGNISGQKVPASRSLEIEELKKGILENNRTVLARGITLIESNSLRHFDKAQELIKELLPYTGKSVRIGISGPPGVGKSTFIEAFGVHLCSLGHKTAVLAIDPTSSLTRGSILGDKTRMERLSSNRNAFIRPSPSGGTLGGVARKTREAALLCEAAGYDVILIETVGVGQSEITARSMVDFYILMLLPGSGDEIQGIKKGVVEIADLIVVNKAEGDGLIPAKVTKEQYNQALHYLQQATEGWTTKAITISAANNDGIDEVWNIVGQFLKHTKESGIFETRRRSQTLNWFYSLTEDELKAHFYNHPQIKAIIGELEEQIVSGAVPPTQAVDMVMKKFLGLFKD